MATPDGPVTELVEIPLCVPFEDFLSIFTQKLEPVLLTQPGIISVLTGSCYETSSQGGTFAVSLTQWETMEAHAAFLQGPEAGPFFETVKHLASGPPTINHYYIGPLPPAALKSEYAWFRKYSASDNHTQSQGSEERGDNPGAVTLVGDCLEIESQRLWVTFGDVQRSRASGDAGKAGGSESSFTVVWRKRGTARVPHSL